MKWALSCTGLHVVWVSDFQEAESNEMNPVIGPLTLWKEARGLGGDKEHEANLVEVLCMEMVWVALGDGVARDDRQTAREEDWTENSSSLWAPHSLLMEGWYTKCEPVERAPNI